MWNSRTQILAKWGWRDHGDHQHVADDLLLHFNATGKYDWYETLMQLVYESHVLLTMM
jgi:hypothetical protein